MTLVEHLKELRTRLFRASLAIVAGTIAGYFVAHRIQDFITRPYCEYMAAHAPNAANRCQMNVTSVLDPFMLQLKIALYVGLVIAAPFWLYQLWAFIAPGL